MPKYIAENDVYSLFNARGVAQLHVGDIDVLPRADVVEVVHGQWELPPSSMHRRCSICKKGYDIPKFNVRANYCPNCGAKMDSED